MTRQPPLSAYRGMATSMALSRVAAARGEVPRVSDAASPARPRCARRAVVQRRAVCASATASSGAPPAAAVEAFWRWLGAQGVDTSTVAPVARPGQGLGLACTRPLRAGETALLVPRTVWLTAATAAASPLGPHLAGQPAWASLALYLLAERADPGSRWAPYLALLPPVEELHSPVLWSAEEELRELSGSQLGASAAAYRAYCADTWAQLAAGPLARAGELLCPPAVFNEHAFLWAFATLRARCLPPCDSGEDIALVPGLDLVNYARGAGPAWLPARAPGGFLARLAPGDAAGAPPPALALQPSRAMAQGEQLVGSYGEGRVDSQLALDFGFVDPDAPVPGYLLQLSLSEEDRFLDDKADVVSLARLPPSPQFALTPGAPPPQDLRAFLRLMHLGGTDAFLLEPIFRDNCWAILSEPVSLANEQAACASMIQGCAAALEGYPTGVREDQEALRAPGSHRRELALRVRMGEKRALQACMESFQSALAGAPQLEYYQERRLRSLKLLDESGKTTFDPFNESFNTW